MRFRPAPALCAAVLVISALAGCTSPAAPATGSTSQPSAPPSTVPSPTSTASAPPEVDPADLTTWTITAGGIGPIERGEDSAELVDELTTFEAIEWCPGVVRLERNGAARIVLDLAADGAQVGNLWLIGRPDDGSAWPTTEEGIRLGSSAADLTTAYPDLSTVGQSGSDTWVHAVGNDEAGWIDFVVEDDVVVLVGASARPGAPKEWCA